MNPSTFETYPLHKALKIIIENGFSEIDHIDDLYLLAEEGKLTLSIKVNDILNPNSGTIFLPEKLTLDVTRIVKGDEIFDGTKYFALYDKVECFKEQKELGSNVDVCIRKEELERFIASNIEIFKQDSELTTGEKSSLTQQNNQLKKLFNEMVICKFGRGATAYQIAQKDCVNTTEQTIKKYLNEEKK